MFPGRLSLYGCDRYGIILEPLGVNLYFLFLVGYSII